MEKEIVKVDMMGLVRELMQVKSAIPASVLAVTEEKMNKKNNPFYERVTKKQKSNIFINFNYAQSVNKRLIKEHLAKIDAGEDVEEYVEFVPKPRVWGEKIPNTCLVLHKGEYFLEVGYLTNNDPKVEYMVDGIITEKSEIEEYLKEKPISKSQGLSKENEVIIRSFNINSILELTMNGKHYIRTDI